MPDTITIEVPKDAPDRDLDRVEREAAVARRNAEIVRRYHQMQGDRMVRYRRLAEEYPVSERQVRRIICGS